MDGPMGYYTITLFFLIVSSLFFLSKLFSKSKLPPGPFSWPIIGNIHKLGNKPHHDVTELAKIYGPIMSIKLGSITTIVISSLEKAQEMLLKHDLDFSGKGVLDAVRGLNHDQFSIVFLPICPMWRRLRKIATIQLFTTQRLNASQVIRQKKVNELVEYVQQCCKNGIPVDIGKAAFTTTLNLLSTTFFSMDLASHDGLKSQDFKELVWHMMEVGAKPNVSDFFPLLKSLDVQGILKRATGYAKEMVDIFDEIIDGRLKDSNMGDKDDVLSTLLKLVADEQMCLDEVKHMLLASFLAGTDTTSNTLEWAMTELLRNPQKMKKAQMELEQVFGKGGTIQELNISKLPYIQAIVNETFRLHPPTPFLIPYKAEKNVEFCDYLVPKNAHIWVNVWAIGRDPKVWSNPHLFSPERFLDKESSIKVRDVELISFGAGRRVCPGKPLAERMLHLMLTNLLHLFDWKCCDGLSLENIDVQEKFGITLQKARPLQAIPFLR